MGGKNTKYKGKNPPPELKGGKRSRKPQKTFTSLENLVDVERLPELKGGNMSGKSHNTFTSLGNLVDVEELSEGSAVTNDDMGGKNTKNKPKKYPPPKLKDSDSSAKSGNTSTSHEKLPEEKESAGSFPTDDTRPNESVTKTQEVHPKEFIGTLQQVDETPKQYIGQLKSEENETKEKVTSEEETDDESIHHGQESPDAIEFNDFDGKDIDIDENSKIFLKNMLLSNVETCDIDDLENGDISGSTSDKDCSNDMKDRFQPNFAEFPSHKTLRKENRRYLEWKKKYPGGRPVSDGYPLPDDAHKKDIFTKEKFVSIDKHALQTPQDYLNKTVREVVTYLTKVCTTDLEKVRVIFRWCCAQNLANLKGTGLQDTVKENLINIKEDRGSYTTLYESMCKHAGIQCEVIQGITKAAGYSIGQTLSYSSAYGSWVAVKIDSLWRLVDLNFAARHQTGGCRGEWELIDDNGQGYQEVDDAPIGLTYIVDEYYFLTDPEEFIYNHFPDEEHWQLLVRPVTKLEFENMAYLRGSFFTMGMDVLQFKRGTIHAPSGDTVMKFGLPKDDCRNLMYRLWKSSKDENMDSDLKGNKLTQYVYLEQRDGTVMCKVMYPVTGKYKFQLYVGKSGNQYSLSAEYLLLCTEIKELCPALPINNRQEWGPGHKLMELGIKPINCEHGTIETNDGKAELLFTQDPKRPVDILVSLSCQSVDKADLKECTLSSMENGKVAIYIRLQDKGHYALDIYAKHRGAKGGLSLVCTYLIVSTSGVFNQLKFPTIANQTAGSVGKTWTVSPVSHPEPYFTSKEGSETIQLQYNSPLTFGTTLCLHKDGNREEIENLVALEQEENNITFKVRFPKSGMFELNIFANKRGTSGSLSCVYIYVIHAVLPMMKCKPFPKYYSAWGLGCKLRGLTDGELCEDEQIDISVVVPKASDVAVIKTDGNWTHLKKTEQKEWIGKINTGAAGKGIKLAAKLGSSSYNTLAEYQVFTAEQLKQSEEKLDEEYQSERKQVLQEEMDQKQKENEFQEVEKELSGAISSQNLKRLYKSVGKVEEKSYISKLKPKYNTVRNSIKSLERTQKLENAIMKLEPSSITDIQSRSTTSKLLAEIMKATSLLLDGKLDLPQDLDGKGASGDKLKQDIAKFCLGDLSPEVASRSLELLKSYRFEDVKEESDAAACLYAWCLGMTEELKVLQSTRLKSKARKPIPF